MTDELHDACAKGDYEKVKDLVENKGADVNQLHSIHMMYPIYSAAQSGHLQIIKYLLSKGAKASAIHNICGNLIYWTCRCWAINERDAILDHMAQNFAEYHFLDGTTKMHVAVALFGLLAECPLTDLLAPNNDGVTPLYFALLKSPGLIIKLMSHQKIDFSKIIVKPANIPSLDDWYRNYLHLMSFLLVIFGPNQLFEQAFEIHTLCLAAHEQIRDKTEKDKDDLALLYRRIVTIFVKIGHSHHANKEYQQAIEAYKNSNTAIENIKNKKENDYIALDFNHRKIALSSSQLGYTHKQSQNYPQEIDALTCEMCALEKIVQKTDDDRRRMANILTRLGDIYSDINILPIVSQRNKMDPMLRYQNAIAVLSNIDKVTPEDYVSFAVIYNRWKGSCASHTLAWSFAQFAFRSFSPGLPTFGTENDFLHIHTELVNAHNWQNNMHLIRPMIQFMELLLKNYNKQYFPDNMLKKFLLENESNREWFRSKLNELKQFPLLSLERTMLSNIHPLITLVGMVRGLQDKAKTTEEEIKTLQDKNQVLEAQVAQLRQGASTVTINAGNSTKSDSDNKVESDKPATTHFILLDSPVLAANHRPIETVVARDNQKHTLGNPDEEQPAKTRRVATSVQEPELEPTVTYTPFHSA